MYLFIYIRENNCQNHVSCVSIWFVFAKSFFFTLKTLQNEKTTICELGVVKNNLEEGDQRAKLRAADLCHEPPGAVV